MSGTALAPPSHGAEAEAVDRIRERLIRPMPNDGWWGWLLPLGITAVAAFMRFWHLGRPGDEVFDETYYRHDAWNLLHHGVELDKNSGDQSPGFIVHPPLGKWMIAVGEQLFGNHPVGWRFSAAVVGTLSVLMIARIARRMFRSTVLGCVAGLLLTFEALEFVQSRISMLDIFLMFWVLAAFGALLIDRDVGRQRMADAVRRAGRAGGDAWLGLRPWRWVCGFCLGAATATKWSGVFWVPAFLVLAVVWDWGMRRAAGSQHPFGRTMAMDATFALLPFVVFAAAVYVASWTGWFLSDGAHAYDHDRYVRTGQSWFAHDRAVLRGWWSYQREILNFHSHLDASHPYLSRPYGWLLLSRPVAYFYASPKGCGSTSCSQEVLGIGTPAIWWLTIPALVAVLWRMLGRFDWRAAAVLVGFLAGYLPWFYEDGQHRTMFLFYLLPAVPFMVLALTMAIGMTLGPVRAGNLRRTVGAVVAGAFLVLAVANFGYLYPVLAGENISYTKWHHRMWLERGCDQGKHRNEQHELALCWI